MDHLISMFIDDELNMEEKIDYIEKVHEDKSFKDESIALLRLEQRLRSDVTDRVPEAALAVEKRSLFSWLRPVGYMVPAVAVTAVVLLFLMMPAKVTTTPHRFVIHRPDVSKVEIAGSFTQWRKVSLKRAGTAGYWEITLDLPHGEHQFSYIFEDRLRLADPTILTREKDDFGGENSILLVGV
ncbi:MAG: glycogen-binding domain-containing protein [Deltaproteobacteria bacterium]|nr:glycogen-binding domain-containing protein [Deltaproteobacteria bacterium]